MIAAIVRWTVAPLFFLCFFVAFVLPAAGILLSLHAPPSISPGTEAATIREANGRLLLGKCYREPIGQLWHLHLEGSAAEIGYAHGALVGDLTSRIENEMMATFVRLVPSFLARHAILGMVGWNNRHLADYYHPREITEIAAAVNGIVRFHDRYRLLLPHYYRALSYHALHDISHYLIDNPFINAPQIGCTAVAVNGPRVANGHLLIGRLFDFEGGVEFDQNKVVMTVKPDDGLAFVSVGWAGLTGAVTGMNEAGLWVSINAGASVHQGYVGRPIIMVVREILQYCSTIDQAVAVLERAQVFVSDAVLLASKDERRAVIAEVGPTGCAVREISDGLLVATNHFLAPQWRNDPTNSERMESGTTCRRFERAQALALETAKHTPQSLMDLLRDRRGLNGEDIGFGNRSSINAWIGAHLAVADLDEGLVYVCEPSHGLGRALPFSVQGPVDREALAESEDLALHDRSATRFEQLRKQARRAIDHESDSALVLTAEMLSLNPNSFEAHYLAALASHDPAVRIEHLRASLWLQPAYPRDEERIRELLAHSGAAP